MYILTTLEFPTHYFDFHLMTTNVNAKYYYLYILYVQCTCVVPSQLQLYYLEFVVYTHINKLSKLESGLHDNWGDI